MDTPEEVTHARFLKELRELAEMQVASSNPLTRQWGFTNQAYADLVESAPFTIPGSVQEFELTVDEDDRTLLDNTSDALLSALVKLADEYGMLGVSQVTTALLSLSATDYRAWNALMDAHRPPTLPPPPSVPHLAPDLRHTNVTPPNQNTGSDNVRWLSAHHLLLDVGEHKVTIRVLVTAVGYQRVKVNIEGREEFDFPVNDPTLSFDVQLDRPRDSHEATVTVTGLSEAAPSHTTSFGVWLPQLDESTNLDEVL